MRPVIKPFIVQYNEDDYDVLRTYLFDALGPYCSYCEAPISNASAVEHKVPKETLSRFATAWYNLLIACQSCNSAKGQTPLNKNNNYRDTLAQWVWPDKIEQLRSDPRPGLPVDETCKLLTYEYSSKTRLSPKTLESRETPRLPCRGLPQPIGCFGCSRTPRRSAPIRLSQPG